MAANITGISISITTPRPGYRHRQPTNTNPHVHTREQMLGSLPCIRQSSTRIGPITACDAGSQHQISFLILWRAASMRKNGPGLKPNISPWPYISPQRSHTCICIDSLLLAKAVSCATSCVGLQQLAIEYMSRRHSCTTIQARREQYCMVCQQHLSNRYMTRSTALLDEG